MFDFTTLKSKSSEELNLFRQQVCRENGAEGRLGSNDSSWLQIQSMYDHLTISNQQEIYKFSDHKWSRVQFSNIEAFQCGQTICSISGAQIISDWLRIGMHHYTLLQFRKTQRALMYRQHGFFSRHLSFAAENRLKGVFFSVHTHNTRLLSYTQNLRFKRFSPESHTILYLKDIKNIGEEVFFNGVNQHIFYYSIEPGAYLEKSFFDRLIL
jgi:hypothetical protein